MATQIFMPQMGFDMKEGTLVRWIKHEGDAVKKGEAIAEIETDKAVVEVEAFASGVLRKITVQEGATVPVGEVIGVIGEAGEEIAATPVSKSTAAAAPTSPAPLGTKDPPAEAPPKAAAAPAARAAAPAAPTATEPAPKAAPARRTGAAEDDRVKASPLARKEAETKGIDLAQVTGTGPGGRITREDIMAFKPTTAPATHAPALGAAAAAPADPRAAPPPPGPRVDGQASATKVARPPEPLKDGLAPLSRMRQAIAAAMARSMREIPHFYVTIEIDMTEAMKLRGSLNKALEGDVKISVNDMIVKACAKALLKHPHYNASYSDQGLQMHGQVNVSMAVALDDGLVAPSITDAGSKSLAEIARASSQLISRARSGVLSAAEYTGGTFSVSNMGMYNIEDFTAIITPPQSGALAVGSVHKAPVVRDDQVKIIDSMKVTLSTDHRVADGAQAAKFLAEIRTLLESPVLLLV